MGVSRRGFLGILGGAAAGATLARRAAGAESGVSHSNGSVGCLVDLSLCAGCRKCEAACNQQNGLPPPDRAFEDMGVLDSFRRPDADHFTVVNRHVVGGVNAYSKVQCLHCLDPACVSACIVGALTKEASGAVRYDASKCIGCRYCMVACPFQIPAYEYADALTPRVRKCEFCFERQAEGKAPACATACPKEAIAFGPRGDLLAMARERIRNSQSAAVPGAHSPEGEVSMAPGPQAVEGNGAPRLPLLPHIYGEREVGGTSWLYVACHPFESLGFLRLPAEAPPRLTETIQHGTFKNFIPPLGLAALLGLAMISLKGRRETSGESNGTGSREDRSRHK
jgi:Fe-S-cluster-containing dehydrogenase component